MSGNKPEISKHIQWVYTEDLESTAEFYHQCLGLERIRATDAMQLFATSATACIGVCRVFDDRVVEPRGGMLSIVTDDVDAWYRRLCERGVSIDEPPGRLERFGIYHFFVRDPNGYIIEFERFEDDV